MLRGLDRGPHGAMVRSMSLPDRDPKLAHKLVEEQGALLLDVRTQAEYDEEHVEGSLLIPHDQLARRVDEVSERVGGDKGRPIVVFCRRGGRAATAKDILVKSGFSQVTNVGGMSDYLKG